MTDIQRWDYEEFDVGQGTFEKNDNGEWVDYQDHLKAMEAKDKTIEAQAKEIERLKIEIDRLETYMQTLGGVM